VAVVLEAQGLTKVYRTLLSAKGVKALDGLSLAVEEGETYGLVGPNGSGKTTTLKILLGLVFPDGGRGSIFGKGIFDVSVKERLGYLPEEAYLYDCFSGEELIDFYAKLFGLDRATRRQRVTELLTLVGMQENRRLPFRACSKGMRQRIILAQALVNDPELLILDEPTSGLDAPGRYQMRLIIQELKRRGKTILLCSHFLAEVEEVCDRIGILHRGRLIASGRMEELAGPPAEIRLEAEGLTEETRAALGRFEGVSGVEDGVISLAAEAGERLYELIEELRRGGATLVSVARPRASLQDVFERAIKEEEK
jgi:ABC-2 type transport system ATP-binding protein